MAITVNTLNIVDIDGNNTTLLSTEVKEVNSFNGNVDVIVDVYGENPQIIKTENTSSSGSVTLTGEGNVTDVTVNGVSVFDTSSAIAGIGDLPAQAFNLAVAINTYDSVPNYSASVSGAVVTISADKSLAASPDGFVVASTTTGTATDVNLSGGIDKKAAIDALLTNYNITVDVEGYNTSATSSVQITNASGNLTDLSYNGVSVFNVASPVTGATVQDKAIALISAINSYLTTPDYTAAIDPSNDDTVIVSLASSSGSDLNGQAGTITFTSSGAATVSNLAGGSFPTRSLKVLEIRSVNEDVSGGSLILYNKAENTLQKVEEIISTQSVSAVKALIDAL